MPNLKKIMISLSVLLLFSIISISAVSAHSVLVRATPKEGEQLDEPINTIKLTFNTKVEYGSTLFLVNSEGEEIEPETVDTMDGVLTAVFMDSLDSDTYQVNWKIIGADGHPIEDSYSFSIEAQENTETAPASPQTGDAGADQARKEDNVETDKTLQTAQQENSSEQPENSDSEPSSLNSVPFIVLLVAAAVLLVWLLLGKRKK